MDIDAFVAKTRLRPYKKTYKGQPRFKTKPEGEKIRYSLLSIETSKANFSDLNKQIKDTIQYIKKNKKKLAHISLTKEIEHATLDFGIDLRIDKKNVLIQSDKFPSDLLKLAGDLGLDIELSIYPRDLEKILENKKKRKSA